MSNTILDQWESKYAGGCDLRGKRGLRCAGAVEMIDTGHRLCQRHRERLTEVLADAQAETAGQRFKYGLEPRAAQGT